MSVKTKIASAIKRADKSYFFENYSKQAQSVLRELDKAGYMVLPKDVDEKLLKQVADTIKTGKMKPEQHIANVYSTLTQLLQRDVR